MRLGIFLLLLPSLCFGFFARMVDDPKEFCKDQKLDVKAICDFSGIELPNLDEELLSSISGVEENYNTKDLLDLKSAYSLSDKIILQSKDKIFQLNNISDQEKIELKNALSVISRLKYKIKNLSSREECKISYGDFNSSQSYLSCKKQKEKDIKNKMDLEFKLSLILNEHPLLAYEEFDTFTDNLVENRIEYYDEKISQAIFCTQRSLSLKTCNQSEDSLYSRKEKDTYFNIKDDEFLKLFESGKKKAISSLTNLVESHSDAKKQISEVKLEDASNLRHKIFTTREITRDYYLASEVKNPNSEYSDLGDLSCRILGEYNANELNALTKSLAADLAVTLIPIGGSIRLGKILNRFKLSKQLPSLLEKAARFSGGNKLGTLSAELAAMGVDTSLLENEISQCQEILNVTIAIKVEKGVSEKKKECEDLVKQMTTAYASGLGGGVLGISKLASKVLKTTPKSVEEKVLNKQISQIYDPDGMNCHDNIHRLTKTFSEADIDITDAKVVYITPEGISASQELPYSLIGGGKAPAGAKWNHHVILVKDGKVYDPDFSRDRVPTVEEYLSEMFPDIMKDGDASLANVRMKEFDAIEYRDNFEGGSSAAGRRAGFLNQSYVQEESVSIGDYFNRYTQQPLNVPKPRLPIAYDEYNKPVYLSTDGSDILYESGEAVERSGRITTLDGKTKWLDDEDIIDQLK